MRLNRETYCNPFIVSINGKHYTLGEIYAFKDGKIVAENHCGWFGSNNPFPFLELDCDVVMKRVVDLNCKTAFVIKCNEQERWYNETRYALYIPASVLKLKKPEYTKEYGHMVRMSVESSIDSRICFSRCKSVCPQKRQFDEDMRICVEKLKWVGTNNNFKDAEEICAEIVTIKHQFAPIQEKYDKMSAEELWNNN